MGNIVNPGIFCTVGECIISKRLQKVAHESLLKSGRKSGFKWKQMEEFMEERICGLDI